MRRTTRYCCCSAPSSTNSTTRTALTSTTATPRLSRQSPQKGTRQQSGKTFRQRQLLSTSPSPFQTCRSSSSSRVSFATITAIVGLFLNISLSSCLVAAQSPSPSSDGSGVNNSTAKPAVFLGVASANTDKFVYYHGGQFNTEKPLFSNELIALDTTVSWITSKPAWVNLTVSAQGSVEPPAVRDHSMTLSADQSVLYLTAPTGNTTGTTMYKYDIKARLWSTVPVPPPLKAAWADRRRAIFLTDPKTGAIWYIGGTSTSGIMTNEIDQFQNEAWNTNLATIDGDNNSIDNGNSNASGAPTATVMNRFSGNTAHYHEGRIYIFGGLTMDPASSARSYQSFQNLPWINVTTSTPVIGTQLTLKGGPPQRQYHCSVITSSKKVIIYGGHDSNMNKTFNDIWSLDLITLTWSQIAVKNESRPRYGHNCNLVGANMIVYGGRATKENGTEYGYQDVQVFDIVQADWMQVYNPKLDPTPVSKPVPGGVGDPGNHGGGSDQLGHEGTGRKLSLGAIVGIAVAVVVILGSILVGIWIYRRRQRQIIAREKEMIQMGDSETGNAHGAIGRGSSGGRRSGSHKGQHQRRSRSHRQLPGQHPNNPYRVSASSPLSYSGSTRLNSGNPGDRGSGTLGASGFDSASNTPGPNYMTIGGEEVLDGDQYPYPHRASAALSGTAAGAGVGSYSAKSSPSLYSPGIPVLPESNSSTPAGPHAPPPLTPASPTAPTFQYLMQQLPDGTIAVQPIYLSSHMPIPLPSSPNMIYSERGSLGEFVNSPNIHTTNLGANSLRNNSGNSRHSNDYQPKTNDFSPKPATVSTTTGLGISTTDVSTPSAPSHPQHQYQYQLYRDQPSSSASPSHGPLTETTTATTMVASSSQSPQKSEIEEIPFEDDDTQPLQSGPLEGRGVQGSIKKKGSFGSPRTKPASPGSSPKIQQSSSKQLQGSPRSMRSSRSTKSVRSSRSARR